jgi:signal transduction histidine kinase
VGEPFMFAPSRRRDDSTADNWKVLLVDDEQEVHSVTRFALKGFEFEGKGLEFVSAYSAAEARDLLDGHRDAAILLLDVVMEEDNSGFDVIRHAREILGNDQIRIILRTGHPGQAPEATVVRDYDINDYSEKTELTRQRLMTSVYAALRAFRDILRLQKQGRDLDQARRVAQAAERAKSSFFATASHELRTPLNAILGLSQMIDEEVLGPVGNEKYREYAADIRGSGQRLLNLIENLLDVADGTVSHARLRDESFSLSALIEHCLEDFDLPLDWPHFGAAGLPAEIWIVADRLAMQRMVLCLLSNAAALAAQPSQIDVSVTAEENGALVVTVRHEGAEMPGEDVSRLTGPIPAEGSAFVAGSAGLGLESEIARRLIERHNGQLWVNNIRRVGAAVSLKIPAERVGRSPDRS